MKLGAKWEYRKRVMWFRYNRKFFKAAGSSKQINKNIMFNKKYESEFGVC